MSAYSWLTSASKSLHSGLQTFIDELVSEESETETDTPGVTASTHGLRQQSKSPQAANGSRRQSPAAQRAAPTQTHVALAPTLPAAQGHATMQRKLQSTSPMKDHNNDSGQQAQSAALSPSFAAKSNGANSCSPPPRSVAAIPPTSSSASSSASSSLSFSSSSGAPKDRRISLSSEESDPLRKLSFPSSCLPFSNRRSESNDDEQNSADNHANKDLPQHKPSAAFAAEISVSPVTSKSEQGIAQAAVDNKPVLKYEVDEPMVKFADGLAKDLDGFLLAWMTAQSKNAHDELSIEEEAHARIILARSPAFAAFRKSLCPTKMKECEFWCTYFSRLSEHQRTPPKPTRGTGEVTVGSSDKDKKEKENSAVATLIGQKMQKRDKLPKPEVMIPEAGTVQITAHSARLARSSSSASPASAPLPSATSVTKSLPGTPSASASALSSVANSVASVSSLASALPSPYQLGYSAASFFSSIITSVATALADDLESDDLQNKAGGQQHERPKNAAKKSKSPVNAAPTVAGITATENDKENSPPPTATVAATSLSILAAPHRKISDELRKASDAKRLPATEEKKVKLNENKAITESEVLLLQSKEPSKDGSRMCGARISADRDSFVAAPQAARASDMAATTMADPLSAGSPLPTPSVIRADEMNRSSFDSSVLLLANAPLPVSVSSTATATGAQQANSFVPPSFASTILAAPLSVSPMPPAPIQLAAPIPLPLSFPMTPSQPMSASFTAPGSTSSSASSSEYSLSASSLSASVSYSSAPSAPLSASQSLSDSSLSVSVDENYFTNSHTHSNKAALGDDETAAPLIRVRASPTPMDLPPHRQAHSQTNRCTSHNNTIGAVDDDEDEEVDGFVQL